MIEAPRSHRLQLPVTPTPGESDTSDLHRHLHLCVHTHILIHTGTHNLKNSILKKNKSDERLQIPNLGDHSCPNFKWI